MMALRRTLLSVSAVGLVATTAVVLLPSVRFAYRNPAWHVAIETAAVSVALLAALLMFGRFRRTGDLRDLAIVYVLCVLGLTNLFFATLPSLLRVRSGETLVVWSQATARSIAVAILAFAAFWKRSASSDRVSIPGFWVATASGGTLAGIALLAAVARSALPEPLGDVLAPTETFRWSVDGQPVFLGLQLAQTALFAAAAIGFTRRAEDEGENLMAWFAVASVFGAFSRLNYFLFPSLYTDFVYVGDIFRLGFYICLLIGGVREISWYWRSLALAQLADARQALARDLHDGVAQELVFISAQSRRLIGRQIERHDLERLASAADRAVAESRRAIAALSTGEEQTLAQAVAELGEEVTRRGDTTVSVDLEEVEATPPIREAVVRVVREVLANAVRHSGAATITVELRDNNGPWVRVSDDGKGFDPEAEVAAKRGFGLVSIEERTKAKGGSCRVTSSPGVGTEVVIEMPREERVDDW